jgi:hypothetical protein
MLFEMWEVFFCNLGEIAVVVVGLATVNVVIYISMREKKRVCMKITENLLCDVTCQFFGCHLL